MNVRGRRLKSLWGSARKSLTNPRGTPAAIAVIAGLVAVVVAVGIQLSTVLQPQKATVEDLAVYESLTRSGRPWAATTYVLAPYDAALPAIRADAYPGCGAVEDEFLNKWVPLTTFDRFTFENTVSTAGHPIQILDIRAQVLQSRPAQAGVVVHCPNNAGPNSGHATISATEGAVASGPDGKPLVFTLAQGEQFVVELQIQPSNEDTTVNLIADVIIQGKAYETVLNSEPIEVHSPSAAGPWQMGWGEGSWLCFSREGVSTVPPNEELDRKCTMSTYSRSDIEPTVQNTLVETWFGTDRRLIVEEDGYVTEEILADDSGGQIFITMMVEGVSGPSVVDAIATARVVSVAGEPRARTPLPQEGDRVKFEVRNGVLTEQGTGLKYCRAMLDEACT